MTAPMPEGLRDSSSAANLYQHTILPTETVRSRFATPGGADFTNNATGEFIGTAADDSSLVADNSIPNLAPDQLNSAYDLDQSSDDTNNQPIPDNPAVVAAATAAAAPVPDPQNMGTDAPTFPSQNTPRSSSDSATGPSFNIQNGNEAAAQDVAAGDLNNADFWAFGTCAAAPS